MAGSSQDLTQGVLASLLGNYDPEERSNLLKSRTQAYDKYQQVMDQPIPDAGPVQRMVSNYLSRYGQSPTASFAALAQGLGDTSNQTTQIQAANQERQRQAAEFGVKRSEEALKESDMFSKNMFGNGRRGSGNGPTPEQLRTVYSNSRNEAAQIAKDYTFPDAESRSAWIENRANLSVKNYLQNWATQPTGPRGEGGPEEGAPQSPMPQAPQIGMPQRPQAPVQPQAPQQPQRPGMSIQRPGTGATPTLDFQGMTVPQLVSKISQMPDSPDKDAIVQGLAQMGIKLPSAQPQQPVQAGPLIDKRMVAQDKGYGADEGKELFKERQSLTQLHGANSKLLSQLNLLESLYQNPNLPQGELADKLQSIRSGLKSMGIQVDPNVGPADLARAVSTGLSLSQKNADGHNLLPGAMSNYEDQLLQKMAPTLSLTQEGRLSLIKFMKEVASSNLRIAQEATQMSAANKDRLPSEWYKRKERVMLEEMARLREISNQLGQQHGVKK